MPGGRLVFDVFAPSREDIEETHGRWLEREPGIFERADWDEGDADADALGPPRRRGVDDAPRLALAAGVAALLDRAGFDVEAQYGWFDRRPYEGGEDVGLRRRAGELRVRVCAWSGS